MDRNEDRNCYEMTFFSDGHPVPDLLTEQEAIRFLRLDIDGPAQPGSTLKYYRDKGMLKPTRVGPRYRYSKVELLNFIHKATEWTNRRTS